MKRKSVSGVAESTIASTVHQQEALILKPYVDFLKNDDIRGLHNLAQHVGIHLGRNLARAVLDHYRLDEGKYDVDRAAKDFASRPPLPETTPPRPRWRNQRQRTTDD
jgi:hypothetical protein